MARRFATDIDLLKFSLLNAMLNPVSTDPSGLGTGDAGRVWANTTIPTLKFWNGTAAIDLLSRSSQTGTQTASTISDFTTAVQAIRWSSMAVPTAAVNMNTQNFTSLAAASASGQAVEYAQFQTAIGAVQSGLDFKSPPVTVVATANVTVASPGGTISGHTMVAGDSILLTGQTTASQNGIYSWNGASSALTRRSDSNTAGSVYSGTMVSVTGADNTNPDTVWMQTTVGTGSNGAITLGTDSQSWIKPFSSTTYSGSTSIAISGGVISAIAGTGILTAAGIAIDTSIVPQKKVTVVPTATSGAWTISAAVGTYNHGLANYAPQVVVRAYTSPSPYTQGQILEMDVVATDQNNVQITFPAAPASNQFIVQVVG